MTTDPFPRFVLTLSCPDRAGIVRDVATVLADAWCDITESQQFGDPSTDRFFMRVAMRALDPRTTVHTVRSALAPVAERLSMTWELHDAAVRPRVLVLVSKAGHCLNDLLYRHGTGSLPVDLVGVVSNHPDLGPLAEAHGVPFRHLPIEPGRRAEQEEEWLALVEDLRIDLVVLARYMQILSPEACKRLEGRAINIHHSFLPGFKGARPYHQAHARGVKLIGATAHYVTADLDEGPIIEQEVARVDHTMGPDALAEVGRDLECVALARAVRWHAEHRILLNGERTLVFR